MRAIGGGGGETHFTVNIVSASFEGKVRLISLLSSHLLFLYYRSAN